MKFSYSLIKQMVPGLPAKKRLIEELNLKSFEVEDGAGDLINIEIPHNRYSDAASHWGVAKEAAAIFNLKLREPRGIANPTKFPNKKIINVKVMNYGLCTRYGALLVEVSNTRQSPSWLTRALITCGIRPINLVVDVMNYVMLEVGQPLHAFDADKIEKGLIIRPAKKGETITTLDNQHFKLDKGMLVIADAKKAVAVAGIKGGKNAEVDAKTRSVIVEAANFDPVNVYKTSRKLNLVTDASSRFSHGISPSLTEVGINRAAEILAELAHGKVRDYADVNKAAVSRRIIGFSSSKFASLIGLSLSKKEAAAYLTRLGFKVLPSRNKDFDFLVEVPAVRTDITIFEDLVEEVARLYDYNRIPSRPLMVGVEPAREEETLALKDKIRAYLVGAGFSEVYNYSFSAKGDKAAFEIENPIALDKQYLRQDLTTGLKKNIEDNQRFFESIRIFEIGKVFNQKNQEELHLGLALGIKGRKDDAFFELKGAAEHLLERLGIADLFFRPEKEGIMIESDSDILGKIVGFKDFVAAEINLDKLIKLIEEEYEFLPLPKYPAVMRDLSLEMKEPVQVGDILNAIETAPAKDVRDVDLIDYYDPKRFTFRIIFQSDKKTLTDKGVNKEMASIVSVLKKKFRLQVR
ncbi:MAG: phenylalanine--tRNA ligase subunit beta [Candidatus Colwellbacteria bacterium]|nr:phenylalanine--tRNA ligase subunit beta [Candidatus Colwellbacteria bacterium]